MKKILALIPARGGSKGIPRKNLKLFRNKPLIYWSIKQALESKFINRVIVSTDCPEIAETAKKFGAEVPFLRPLEISQDTSTDFEFMTHALNFLKNNQNYIPDLIIQLRPTYPTRKLDVLNQTIQIMLENESYTSLRTVIPIEKSPFKMYLINKNSNILTPLFKEINGLDEPYNRCRQELPQAYLHNGYIDIIRTDTILKDNSMTGNKIYPFVLDKNEHHDLDTLQDWEKAEGNL